MKTRRRAISYVITLCLEMNSADRPWVQAAQDEDEEESS